MPLMSTISVGLGAGFKPVSLLDLIGSIEELGPDRLTVTPLSSVSLLFPSLLFFYQWTPLCSLGLIKILYYYY